MSTPWQQRYQTDLHWVKANEELMRELLMDHDHETRLQRVKSYLYRQPGSSKSVADDEKTMISRANVVLAGLNLPPTYRSYSLSSSSSSQRKKKMTPKEYTKPGKMVTFEQRTPELPSRYTPKTKASLNDTELPKHSPTDTTYLTYPEPESFDEGEWLEGEDQKEYEDLAKDFKKKGVNLRDIRASDIAEGRTDTFDEFYRGALGQGPTPRGLIRGFQGEGGYSPLSSQTIHRFGGGGGGGSSTPLSSRSSSTNTSGVAYTPSSYRGSPSSRSGGGGQLGGYLPPSSPAAPSPAPPPNTQALIDANTKRQLKRKRYEGNFGEVYAMMSMWKEFLDYQRSQHSLSTGPPTPGTPGASSFSAMSPIMNVNPPGAAPVGAGVGRHPPGGLLFGGGIGGASPGAGGVGSATPGASSATPGGTPAPGAGGNGPVGQAAVNGLVLGETGTYEEGNSVFPEYAGETFSHEASNVGEQVLTREGKGQAPATPYGGEASQTGLNEKSIHPDSNRTEPITEETGSKQNPATANSIVGASELYADAKSAPVAEVHGTAAERANMGKGAASGYEFAGPYDYPTRGISNRPDSTLTAVGAWRSKTGEHSNSLWESSLKKSGEPSKRKYYFKHSSKGGGKWKQVNVNYFKKANMKKEGGLWMGALTQGTTLQDYMSGQLRNKQKDINLAKKGNELKNQKMHSGSTQM